MKELSDNVISKDLYDFFMAQGISYEGYVEGVGYAYSGVSAIKQPINKSGHTITRLVKNNVLVADNTSVRGKSGVNHAEEMKMNARYKEFHREKQREVHKVVEQCYEDRIKAIPRSNPEYNELTSSLQDERTRLLRLVDNESHFLSFTDFPLTLFHSHQPLLKEYIEIREISTGKRPVPSSSDRLERGPSNYEKFVQARAGEDPFATQLALRPEIQLSAISLMGFSAAINGAFNVSLSSLTAYKGVASFIGQSFASTDGIKGVNYIGVFGDALFSAGTGAVLGSFVEFKPFSEDKRITTLGYKKPLNHFFSDALISFSFGKVGGGGLNRFQSFLTTSEQQIFHNVYWHTWLYFGTYRSAEKVKEDKVFEKMKEDLEVQLKEYKNFYK